MRFNLCAYMYARDFIMKIIIKNSNILIFFKHFLVFIAFSYKKIKKNIWITFNCGTLSKFHP